MFPSDQHDYVKILVIDLLGMLNEEKLVCSFMLSVFSCHALELDVKRFSVKITSLHHLHGEYLTSLCPLHSVKTRIRSELLET